MTGTASSSDPSSSDPSSTAASSTAASSTVTAAWSNWAGNQSADGVAVARPRGTAQITAAVTRAAQDGVRVKPIGTGHSFTGIGRPEGMQLVLDRHDGLVQMDAVSGLVTVQAGMPLHRLVELLARAGLAMTNLGDIAEQTVAGAMSTGTHGTGARFGGLATQVRALELVLADGSVLPCSPTVNPEVFRAARVGLGALGVVSTVTLQTVPAFALQAREESMPLAEVLDRFDELADATDHFEFYWFPHTAWALVKRNTRLPLEEGPGGPGGGVHPLPAWRHWWDDEFLSNTVFGAMVGLGRRAPRTVRPMNRIAARALGARTYTDLSHRVFTSPRRVRFVEMEYAVPRAAAVEVVTRIGRAIDAAGWDIAFPMEVRVAAGDDIPLSTACGRDSAYVAVHVPAGADHESYFRTVEAIAGDHDGRPHWGKMHYLDAGTLQRRYPDFDEFVALRDRLDPAGMFRNAYLDRVLGAASVAT